MTCVSRNYSRLHHIHTTQGRLWASCDDIAASQCKKLRPTDALTREKKGLQQSEEKGEEEWLQGPIANFASSTTSKREFPHSRAELIGSFIAILVCSQSISRDCEIGIKKTIESIKIRLSVPGEIMHIPDLRPLWNCWTLPNGAYYTHTLTW